MWLRRRLATPNASLGPTLAIVVASAACAAGRSNYDSEADGAIEGEAPPVITDASTDSFPSDASMSESASDATFDGATTAPEGAPGDGPAEADSAPPTCAGVEILCNGSCVNPTNDPNHCGGCGTSCSSGLCGTSIAADMSSSPAGWRFNGSAVWDSAGPSARMTAASAAGATGTVIYAHPVVTDDFTVSFQFRIGANGGGRYDGMGFMIESTGPTAVGGTNGSLGMGGLGGYGVELDVYDNGQCSDTSADHVGVDSLSSCAASTGLPTSLFASGDLTSTINLADAKWHAVTVSLSSGAMSVTIDASSVASNVSLTGFAPGTPYYYGFSGATGGLAPNGGIQTEVKAVTMTFPTPRCL
jgi:hypothetical protein